MKLHLKKTDFGFTLVKKGGEIKISDIHEALAEEKIEDAFALFVRKPEYQGWGDDNRILGVDLHRLDGDCPVCPHVDLAWKRKYDDLYGPIYEEAYQAGYAQAQRDAGMK